MKDSMVLYYKKQVEEKLLFGTNLKHLLFSKCSQEDDISCFSTTLAEKGVLVKAVSLKCQKIKNYSTVDQTAVLTCHYLTIKIKF